MNLLFYLVILASLFVRSVPYFFCCDAQSTVFWTWIAQAVIESVFVSVVPLYLLMNTSPRGESGSFWESGATTLTVIIITINIKVFCCVVLNRLFVANVIVFVPGADLVHAVSVVLVHHTNCHDVDPVVVGCCGIC
jgi:hypothetical protein